MMELSRYPLDTQVCAMQISSCKYLRNNFYTNDPIVMRILGLKEISPEFFKCLAVPYMKNAMLVKL